MPSDRIATPRALWSGAFATLLLSGAVAQGQEPLRQDALSEYRLRALLTPQLEATLSSRMEGTLETLPVSLGDAVAEGDVLARFDCRVEQARVNVASTERAVARLNADAKRNLRALDAVGDLEVALAAAEVDKAESSLSLAAAQRDRCTLVAPFTGRIAKVHVKPFQTLGPGTALVDLIGDGALKLRLSAPSELLPRLATGQALSVRVNETGKRYPATLSAISARIDAVAQTVELEATLDSPHAELMAGMTGRASLNDADDTSADRSSTAHHADDATAAGIATRSSE
ncbi:efflux RND transporter periplasmic adaptor subunit [Salinicola aestuarinus]|uniref:efflux RND transporter periplasmic adaptor subunit n=1 Tax=Salinicola aestuarinus TaxID=1949082 RepID=UPI000DA1551E|nr:efflux RND transporter periplasmic adaptor subunit [Salinicola aestuarinus]